MSAGGPDAAAQRIDVWLWRARFFKTRSLAAKAVSAGTIRIDRNGAAARIEKASALVRAGDVLSFAVGGGAVRIVAVKAFGDRRGPAAEAALLYDDRTPAPLGDATPAEAPLGARSGRPTKKERRALDRVMGRDP